MATERVIYISTSEHGKGTNKCLKSGCYEDKHTRPIGNECKAHLEYNGFKVVMAKAGTSMATRCAESNRVGADLHVPIHTNAAGSSSARYLMFMFWADNTAHRKLFNAVSKRMEAVYPGKKDAVFAVRKDLYEINTPNAMTLYCELGFHTNKTDVNEFIHKPAVVGKALAQGICDYFGVKFKDKDKDQAEKEAEKETKPATTKPAEKANLVKVSTKTVDIVKEPPIVPEVVRKCPVGVYTIVEEKNGYGKLKSGEGWIKLADVKKV